MAGLNVSCVPRKPELLWRQNASGHLSYPLFAQGLDCELKARRGESGLTKKLSEVELDDRVKELISNAGFGGVLDAPVHQLDHLLIKALVERWRPETNTFHFPIGEATVTLQDVQVIWGLPIEGEAVTGQWLSEGNVSFWNNHCLNLLGFIPDDEDHLKGGKIKISELVNQIGVPYDAEDEVACEQKARQVILAMCACYLFVDAKTYDISLNFLDNLIDLSVDGRKAWGAAVVANLYRNLTKTTTPGRKGVDGPLLLLQYWAWERMPRIAPTIDNFYDYSTSLANRWFGPMSHTLTPSHVATAYRSFFEALRNVKEYFNWTPYDDFLYRLPDDCTSGEEIWAYCGPLIFWNEVEPHLANRVARQFGFVQDIPMGDGLLTPAEHDRLQATRNNWVVGSTTQAGRYNWGVRQIKAEDPAAWLYLKDIGLEKWTLRHDQQHRRWGNLTTNVAESINNVLGLARMLPIRALIEHTFDWTRLHFVKQYRRACNWEPPLSRKMWKIFQRREAASTAHTVDVYDERTGLYSVRANERNENDEYTYTVTWAQQKCTCGNWQNHRFPCSHAIAVNGYRNEGASALASKRYTTRTWQNQYSVALAPLRAIQYWEQANWRIQGDPLKLVTHRGRRRTRRYRNEMDESSSTRSTQGRKTAKKVWHLQ